MNATSAPAAAPPQPLFITPAEIVSEFSHHTPLSLASTMAALLQLGMLRSRNVIKDLINADHVDEVSIVDNATTAVSIVLQHIAWGFAEGRFYPGDATVMFHCAYGAVKKSVEAYFVRTGGYVIEVPLPFPLYSDDEIVQEFRQALEKAKQNNRRVRLAIIDHVTFMPTVVIPVKQIVNICRSAGVDHIFIDAAHGIGCVDVDMKQIGADFYTSNLHKWLFCPPSATFDSCTVEGLTKALLCIIPFEGGIDGIKKRNHDAVVEMGEMLAKAWGTHLGCPSVFEHGYGGSACLFGSVERSTHFEVTNILEGQVWCRSFDILSSTQGRGGRSIYGYAQISYQVYNKVEDYYKFRDAISQLVQNAFTCASLPNS
ncbi:putative L-cysteine desulfhydrase [Hibiscus syriacus]|uniref:L-cysteine desulfhydrase n=1 Tax=Hibiscus syriacus TaxID=106335 RepID=A0A6A2YA33_HIBSY|nr:putative L-cysteine desulfhydrase [Hibiscus syriacus]